MHTLRRTITMPQTPAHHAIVSSDHLSTQSVEMSEFEFGLIMASHAFSRWIVRCMSASGMPELGSLDILALHSVNHRHRPKRAADICLVFNIEDSHTVTYALKKLLKLGLVATEKRGKETYFLTTEEGRALCEKYAAVRRDCLLDAVQTLGFAGEEMGATSTLLRALSGIYDQASRAAASL
ncbi:transcriptional regulator [Pokkaliibacter plantistimulans]|uniref:Transcriptional regulator n=2 Tax=Balneatrichaceae TaxID=2301193 RepID=A0ABX5LRT8_9GAMM|nr:transcriptional regulator [Pokkaliibacter plantistimulans]